MTKTRRTLMATLALTLCVAGVSAARAQSAEAFVKAFSGQWYVFDNAYSSGPEPCGLQLGTEGAGDPKRYEAKAESCTAPLSALTKWHIEEGQLQLLDAEGTTIAQLGGNQLRVTGDLGDGSRAVIAERGAGNQDTAALAAAIRKHRCVYSGFTSTCAEKADLQAPEMTGDDGAFSSVGVLVKLNVRNQPRNDAPVIGVLNEGTCLKVNYCTTASDGVWCRARFGAQSGWVKKTALRQSEWPVMTYANSCTAEPETKTDG